MVQIPTVRLQHRTDPTRFRTVDQPAYARDIAKWKDFKIVGMKGGDASDAQVEAAIAEHDANEARRIERDADRDFHLNDVKPASAEMIAALTGADQPAEASGGDGGGAEEAAADPSAAEVAEDETEDDTAPARRGRGRPRKAS